MRCVLVMLIVLIAAAPAAIAQESLQSLPDTEAGRYILRRVDDGLMRVDRETGATSFCRKRDEAWICEAVADDRVALEEEIGRLSEDNAKLAREIGRLKERIARLESGGDETAKTRPQKRKPPAGEDQPGFDFPSEEEMDEVMKGFESMVRRFLDMMRDLREEYDQDRT